MAELHNVSTEPIQDHQYEVRYLCVTGGSGSTRMWLDQVPDWLAANPGYMIIGLDLLGLFWRTR